jgi:PAS domain S-box-containing protein
LTRLPIPTDPIDGSPHPQAARDLVAARQALERRTEELQQQREQVQAAFSQAAVGIATVGRDQRFIDTNLRISEMLGYSGAELRRMTFRDLTHPEDLAVTDELVGQLIAGTIPRYVIEKRYLHKDGRTVWVRVTVTLLRDPDGSVDRFIGVIDDISDRKQTEEALRDARARLEATLSAAEIGSWSWDVVANRVSADRNLALMFGVPPHLAEAGTLQDYLAAIHPEDQTRVQAALAKAMAAPDGRFEIDYRLQRAAGSARWVAARGRAVRDESGQVVRLPGVVIDITARKRAEEAVLEGVQRLQLVLAASNLGDWYWDATTDIMRLGPRAAEIYGVPTEPPQTRGAMRAALLGEHAERARVAAEHALRTRTDYIIEYSVQRPSGDACWVAVRGRGMYASDGSVLGMIGVVQDITERRRLDAARAHLAAVVESSDDAIISKTLDSNIVTWNTGAERMFGYRADEVIGRPISILIPDEHLAEEPTIIERLKRGERIEHYETVRKRRDGSLLHVSVTVSPIKDRDGAIVGASNVARDISQQKQLNAALLETDRRKDEFLATLAHELRNPLAPIRQAALISKDPAATEAQKRWSHDVINRQVQHMALLLDDLLDISRITRGTLELRTEATDLAAIVEAAVETARPAIDARGHTFSVELPREPIRLVADKLRLAQVLANLLTNAAKYTDPGGSIRLQAWREPAGELAISVRDSGIGIAPDALTSVFEMFSQVTATRDRSEGGLGIGLALSRGLVSLHDGRIEARSEGSGRGSEFVVHLPLRDAVPPERVPPLATAPRAGVRRQVLVADDNRDAADSLAMLLRMEGHEVEVVHDGRAALEALLGGRAQVALLDIGMPEMNGYEIARQLRSHSPGSGVALIAVTGWGQGSDKAEALAAGFDHHFTKPVDPDRLIGLLGAPEL